MVQTQQSENRLKPPISQEVIDAICKEQNAYINEHHNFILYSAKTKIIKEKAAGNKNCVLDMWGGTGFNYENLDHARIAAKCLEEDGYHVIDRSSPLFVHLDISWMEAGDLS